MIDDDFVYATEEVNIPEDSMKLVKVVGRSVLIARHDGKVYGVSNRCPHMGCDLSNGKLKDYIVTCPCHNWNFDIRTGEYQFNKAITLNIYECKIEDGKIFVKMMDM
jgi:nitrite reductase/ring-hydroxylating ferredoxin subunit